MKAIKELKAATILASAMTHDPFRAAGECGQDDGIDSLVENDHLERNEDKNRFLYVARPGRSYATLGAAHSRTATGPTTRHYP